MILIKVILTTKEKLNSFIYKEENAWNKDLVFPESSSKVNRILKQPNSGKTTNDQDYRNEGKITLPGKN